MRFGEVLKLANTELYVSPKHDEWLRENSNPTYSPAAKELMSRELGKTGRRRAGTVSASSLGSCIRKQQFTYLGWDQLQPDPRTAGIFHNGTMMHLRWQMAGLTAHWLMEAEVPILKSNEWGLSGTADGICSDGSVLELKSINDNGYKGVVAFGAKEDHKFQLASYMMCLGIDRGRFIYENKNTQEYTEIPYELDAQVKDSFIERSAKVWMHIYNQELAEPLDKCMAGEGYMYRSCPFRDRCMKVKTYEEAAA